jgi:hypothetical protein
LTISVHHGSALDRSLDYQLFGYFGHACSAESFILNGVTPLIGLEAVLSVRIADIEEGKSGGAMEDNEE